MQCPVEQNNQKKTVQHVLKWIGDDSDQLQPCFPKKQLMGNRYVP